MEIFFDLKTWERLGLGLFYTIEIAVVSILISIPGSLIIGLAMTSKNLILRAVCRFYLEAIRIIPIIAWLFLVYFGFSVVWELSAIASCIVVFSLWGIAEGADLVRGAVSSISSHQAQSARALGLSEFKIQIYIIIPQAILQLIPSCLNLFTRMIKTTALASLIGVSDILKVAQQIIEAGMIHFPMLSFYLYGLVLLTYYVLCWALSYAGERLRERLDFRG